MNMDNDLVVHTRLVDRPDNEQLDPFFLETPLEWRNLEALLKALYKVPQKRIDVRYIDEDDDLIIISSQGELNEAVRLSQKSQKPLILQIHSMEPHATPERSKASAPPQEDEKIMMDVSPEEETSAEPTNLREDTVKPFMVPGALSGANVVAIEIPDSAGEGQIANECEGETEHGQGTEAAEPAETLETGEVAPKLRRDEETGYWIVRKLKKNLHPQSSEEKTGLVEEQMATGDKAYEQLTVSGLSKAGKRHRLDEDFKEEETKTEHLSHQNFILYMEKMKEELMHRFPQKTSKEVIRRLEAKQLIRSSSVDSASHRKSHDCSIVVHKGTVCDNCEKIIVGTRYKCGNCLNYNLCEDCEARPDVHNIDHVFLKLRRPCPRASSYHGPLLGVILYPSGKECQESEVTMLKKGELEKLFRKADKLKRLEIKNKEKLRRKEEKLRWKKEQQLAQEGISHLKNPESFGVLKADFVCDITLPDNSIVKPGECLTKTWCIENGGSITWPCKTVLRMIRGNMNAAVNEIDVPPLLPGERTNLTVQLFAPLKPGKYDSHWRLFAHEVRFGLVVYCIVEVSKELPEAENSFEPLELPAADHHEAEEKTETRTASPLEDVFKKNEECQDVKELERTLPLIYIEEERQDLDPAASEAHQEQMQATENSGHDASDDHQAAEASCAEFLCHPIGAADNLEQPEKLKRHPPSIVKQSDEDREFWSRRFTGVSADNEPSTPNNTPLDVSPPPERTIHFPEPELLSKLSLQVLDSDFVQSERRSDKSSVTTTEDSGVQRDYSSEAVNQRPPQEKADAGNCDGEHSPVIDWTFVHEQSPDSSASTASSVEVVTGEELTDLDHHQESGSINIAEYLSQVAPINPSDWRGADKYAELESLDSFSDASSSLDDEFFIVRLPDCFDISKPLLLSEALSTGDNRYSLQSHFAVLDNERKEEEEDLESQTDDALAEQPSLDDMLKASGSIGTPTLLPTFMPSADAATSADTIITVFREDDEKMSDAEAAAAGDFENAEENPMEDNAPSCAGEESNEVSPAESAQESDENGRAEEKDAESGASATVSGDCDELPFLPLSHDMGIHANHLVQSAVSVASKAASQVFNTAKDVFYTLQGRQNEGKPSTWKPPESSWTPPKSEWTPPKSEWTPPQSKWKPPQSEWKPPASTWTPKAQEYDGTVKEAKAESKQIDVEEKPGIKYPQAMKRLVEMGFYNKTLNQQLLEEHDGDLESVLLELLQLTDNDWAETRH